MGALERALEALALVALAVWLGGLVVLGAAAAPLVFRIVPAPYAADAMTAVFQRFDMIAVGCAVLVLLVEVAHALLRRPLLRSDVVRASLACGATGLAIFLAMVVSPRIAALHQSGAIRGLGELGERLEATHRLAESVAKAELGVLVIVLALHATRPGRAR
jgi:hypothetical protein